jgi:predicted ATPase/DNA-binding SARP family transcriptional activator
MNAQRHAHQASAAGLGRVDFRLLGPLAALADGEPIDLGPPQQRALLAQLLLRANEAVPVEELVDALWPEDPPGSARHAIQVYVSRLRGALGGPARIEARSRAYVLRAPPEDIDLMRFRQLVAEAQDFLAADDGARAAELLQEALGLWRGRALADLEGETGVREVALELEEERLGALELRLEADSRAGRDAAELLPELEQLVAEYPAREEVHAHLMLTLHRSGRQADAIDAFGKARELLLNELGLEPGPRLRELEAAIRRDDPALTPAPPELSARLHLPAQANRFIGQQDDLQRILALISVDGKRLVTLTGAGGIGKTRLAIEVAERLAGRFEDGVWFADLSAIADPALVASAMARALGAADSSQPLEAYLAEKHVLLVADNFEQVTSAASSLEKLLSSAPGLTLLVTSRVPLRLPEEEEHNVTPLSESEAVQLFLARARAAARRLDLAAEDTEAVAEICAALDGLPLAIELAAATLTRFSLPELRTNLERRLDLLSGGPVDVPKRQQTIRATIEWSHDLLAAVERRLFARLSVFAGGWTADAAAEILGASPETLLALRDAGLIHADGGRFRMLVTIRDFAHEHVTAKQERALRGRHAAYFTRIAMEAEARFDEEGRSPESLDDFGRDYENFVAALGWTRDAGETELFARLAAALGMYWYSRGPFTEGRRWLESALPARLEDDHLVARIAYCLGVICRAQGDIPQAKDALERSLPLFRRSGDRALEAACLGDLGGVEIFLGEHEAARRHLSESRELARKLGKERMLAAIANLLGVLELMDDRLAEAEAAFEESVAAARHLGDHEKVAIPLMNLGLVALRLDRLDDAGRSFREGLQISEEMRSPVQTANNLQGLASVAVRMGHADRAGRLLGAAAGILAEAGAVLEPYLASLEEETRTAVEAALGTDAAGQAFAAGGSERRQEALAYAQRD